MCIEVRNRARMPAPQAARAGPRPRPKAASQTRRPTARNETCSSRHDGRRGARGGVQHRRMPAPDHDELQRHRQHRREQQRRKRRRIEARAGEPDREQGCGDRDHRDVDDHVAGKARPDAEHGGPSQTTARTRQPGRQQRPHYRQLAKKTAGSATNTVATKLSPLSSKVA